MESSFAERELGVLLDNKLTMSQQCTLKAMTANNIRISMASRLSEVILSLYSALVRPRQECRIPFWAPSIRKSWTHWREFTKGHEND